MSIIRVPDAAEQSMIESYIALSIISGGHDLHLFTNDVEAGLTPDQIDQLVTADFTEATFPGYADITITSGWTYTQGNPTVAANTLRSFTRSSTGTPQQVRGYYVTLTGSGDLQWYEQFDAPVTVEFNTDEVRVRPRLTIDDAGGTVIPVGMITPYGAGSAPTGWLLCDGSAVSRTTYPDLFAVLGTAYGVGDGSTTFNLPDMRQRFPLGKATAGTGATIGGTGGAIDHVHDLDTATSHAKVTIAAATPSVVGRRKAVTSWTATHNNNAGPGAGAGGAVSTGLELGGDSDTANPPYQVVAYIVKA